MSPYVATKVTSTKPFASSIRPSAKAAGLMLASIHSGKYDHAKAIGRKEFVVPKCVIQIHDAIYSTHTNKLAIKECLGFIFICCLPLTTITAASAVQTSRSREHPSLDSVSLIPKVGFSIFAKTPRK